MHLRFPLRPVSNAICQLGISNDEAFLDKEAGTGFAIGIDQNRVIVLTAAHVVENLRQRGLKSNTRGRLKSRLSHLGPQEGPELASCRETLHAAFFVNDSLRVFVAEFVSCNASDIALLILKPQDTTFSAEQVAILPLDTSPIYGPKFTMPGIEYDQDGFFHAKETDGGYSVGATIRFAYKTGKLLDTMNSRDEYTGFIKAPSFTTTIPVSGGFSGSPILNYRSLFEIEPYMRPFGAISVCGVASSELPGSHSTCTHISAAFALELQPNGETVLDWMQQGKIPYAGPSPHRLKMLKDEDSQSLVYI